MSAKVLHISRVFLNLVYIVRFYLHIFRDLFGDEDGQNEGFQPPQVGTKQQQT